MAKSTSRKKLPAKAHAEILRLSKAGDRLMKRNDFEGALQKYRQAWDLVPEDKATWEASTWILSSAGEAHFCLGNFEKAVNCFGRAVQCPKGLGNPYIHLRLGQGIFELGDKKEAIQELARAYMGAGDAIFKNEDPKYLAFVRTKLRPPEPAKPKKASLAKQRTAKKKPVKKRPPPTR
jgi:tetratricopeptide (TPR) repeat protein